MTNNLTRVVVEQIVFRWQEYRAQRFLFNHLRIVLGG